MSTLYGGTIITNGLAFLYDAANVKSYPGSGTTWTNICKNGNADSTLSGPTFSGDKNGTFVFDGVNDYAYIPSTSPFSGTKLFTAEFWVNFTSITGDFGASSYRAWLFAGGTGTGASQPEWGVGTQNTTNNDPYSINFGQGGGGTVGSCSVNVSSLMSNGIWYQMVLVRDGSASQVIYLNGVSIGTGNVSNSFADGQTDFGAIHGNASFDGYFNGKMSIIRIYSRALTAQEILSNFNSTRSRFGI